MCFCGSCEPQKTHGGPICGSCVFCGSHEPQLGPPCDFLVHMNHKLVHHVFFWITWTTKNTWWINLWFMCFFWITWTTKGSIMCFFGSHEPQKGTPCVFLVHMNHVCLHHLKACTSHEPRKWGLCGRCGSCVFEGKLLKHVLTIPHGGRDNAW